MEEIETSDSLSPSQRPKEEKKLKFGSKDDIINSIRMGPLHVGVPYNGIDVDKINWKHSIKSRSQKRSYQKNI